MRSLTQRNVLVAAGSMILPLFMLGCGVSKHHPADDGGGAAVAAPTGRCFDQGHDAVLVVGSRACRPRRSPMPTPGPSLGRRVSTAALLVERYHCRALAAGRQSKIQV